LPAGAICLSPVTDLTVLAEAFAARAKEEVLLTLAFCRDSVEMYLGKNDRASPRISPALGDLRGLPPLLVHVGTREILLDDSVRFTERAKAAGVEATLKIWDGLWHVFQLFDFLPEARQAIAELGAFARARFEGAIAAARKED
jgi:acetyl esterase/lipase